MEERHWARATIARQITFSRIGRRFLLIVRETVKDVAAILKFEAY